MIEVSEVPAVMVSAGGPRPRTLTGEVRPGAPVRLLGHLHLVRRLGGVTFLVVRDRSGTVQVVAPGRVDLPRESVLEVLGRGRADPRAPGGVEVQAERIAVLARPAGRPAFDISKPVLRATLETQLDHRALSLRHPRVAATFRIAAALVRGFRQALEAEGFLEIHTSKLVGTATEGGAHLFPVVYGERRAYLAQSPQLYKQICVGAFERVYEVGPVFRNEPHETTRHLAEYTSLDVEAAFVTLEDLLDLETRLVRAMFEEVRRTAADAVRLLGVRIPPVDRIPRMTFEQATEVLAAEAGRAGAPQDGAGRGTAGAAVADDLTPEAERRLGEHAARAGSDFLFVTHFPAASRPFYALPDPERPARSLSFDLLFRGLEVTTGGLRIHDARRLRRRLRERGLDPGAFRGYLEAFAAGMPPHGGFAIGLERFTAQLCGLANLRAATLFPRDRRRVEP